MQRNLMGEIRSLSTPIGQAAQQVDALDREAHLEVAAGQAQSAATEQMNRSAGQAAWTNSWLNSWTKS